MNKRTNPAETGDRWVAYICLSTAIAAAAVGAWMAAGRQWLPAALVLWLVPSLLLVGGLARRARNQRTEKGA